MKAWDEITTAALVGTERGAFVAPRCAGAIGEALARVPGEMAEARLLGCAAVLDGCRRAGMIPVELIADLPSPAEEDPGTECSPKAERLLILLLERTEEAIDQWREILIQEWMALAGKAGKRLPAAALPALLEEGIAGVKWREWIEPLLGRRGAWLAGQNPDWGWALGGGEDGNASAAAWEEGTAAERKAWLRRMREKDPKAARERLEAVWKQEPAQTRAAFLEQLATGLSMDDEPLLEAALDDRSKEVRNRAAELLACLPDSGFVKRMLSRVGPLIQFHKKLLGGLKMEVELPPLETDAVWQRDGLVKEAAGVESGLRAVMLRSIVSAIPLGYWRDKSGAPPEELIKCARKTDWSLVIVGGWAEAARRQRDAAWSQALILNMRELHNEYHLAPLWGVLEGAVLEQTLSLVLNQGKKARDRLFFFSNAMNATDTAPGLPLTRQILADLREALTACDYYDHAMAQELMAVARYGAPTIYPEAEAMVREILEKKKTWNNTLAKFLAFYEFRHAMHKELNP